jgi:hypothetical protein
LIVRLQVAGDSFTAAREIFAGAGEVLAGAGDVLAGVGETFRGAGEGFLEAGGFCAGAWQIKPAVNARMVRNREVRSGWVDFMAACSDERPLARPR